MSLSLHLQNNPAPLSKSESPLHRVFLERRSIRKYKPQAIAPGDLEAILELTHRAPSAWNLQPWRFVVVRDLALRQKLQVAAHGQSQITSAPAVIVLYTDVVDTLANLAQIIHPSVPDHDRANRIAGIEKAFANKTESEREAWGAAQGYIALGYLLLAARAYGYDTVPMLGFNPEQVKNLLNLPSHVQIPAIIPIGYADETGREPHRLSLAQTTRWFS